jgi:hypothetical protein
MEVIDSRTFKDYGKRRKIKIAISEYIVLYNLDPDFFEVEDDIVTGEETGAHH